MNKVSIPILFPNLSPLEQEADTQSAYEIYREIIKENIDYDILMQDMKLDGDRLNEQGYGQILFCASYIGTLEESLKTRFGISVEDVSKDE